MLIKLVKLKDCALGILVKYKDHWYWTARHDKRGYTMLFKEQSLSDNEPGDTRISSEALVSFASTVNGVRGLRKLFEDGQS